MKQLRNLPYAVAGGLLGAAAAAWLSGHVGHAVLALLGCALALAAAETSVRQPRRPGR